MIDLFRLTDGRMGRVRPFFTKSHGKSRVDDRPEWSGMDNRLHVFTDANGRPLCLFMTAARVSDNNGAAALLGDVGKAQRLPRDRGYDASWFGDALQAKGVQPCIPDRRSRNEPIRYDEGAIGDVAASTSCLNG